MLKDEEIRRLWMATMRKGRTRRKQRLGSSPRNHVGLCNGTRSNKEIKDELAKEKRQPLLNFASIVFQTTAPASGMVTSAVGKDEA